MSQVRNVPSEVRDTRDANNRQRSVRQRRQRNNHRVDDEPRIPATTTNRQHRTHADLNPEDPQQHRVNTLSQFGV